MSFLKNLLVTAVAISLQMPVTANAAQTGEKHRPKIIVRPQYPPKHRWHGYGFLPGYRQPPALSEWRDRSTRYGGAYEVPEPRYWHNGELGYGWGRPGFYRGQWNGGSFGPCWTSTPIGMIWNCGR